MASLSKELMVITENKVGALAKAAGVVKEVGVSIRAVCAWCEPGKANFLIVTENNDKASEALKKAGYKIEEHEVVLADLQNRVGSLAEATQKIAQAGVDIDHCYVSASGGQALAVFCTKDNKKALQALG